MPRSVGDVSNLPLRWQLKYRLDRSLHLCRLTAKLARKATRLPRHAYQRVQRRSLAEGLRSSPMMPYCPARSRKLERRMSYPMTRVRSMPALFGEPGWHPGTEWRDSDLPESFMATTGPVCLTNLGRVFGRRGECYTEVWHRKPFLRKHRIATMLRGVEAYSGRLVEDLPEYATVWMLQAQNSHIHGHFLIEILPRLMLATKAGLGPDDRVYFHEAHPNHAEALRILGVRREQTIDARQHPAILAEKAHIPVHTHYMGLVNAALIRETVQFVKDRLTDLDQSGGPDRIHLSRENMPNKHVTNDAEISDMLSDAGFEKIHPEELSFIEQVKLFHNAEAVAGIHCSGMLNTMFCRPGAKVIDFSAANIDNRLHDLLSAIDVHHATVQTPAGSMIQYKRDRSLHVDPRALGQALQHCGLEEHPVR